MAQTPESEETTWHKYFPVQNTSIFNSWIARMRKSEL